MTDISFKTIDSKTEVGRCANKDRLKSVSLFAAPLGRKPLSFTVATWQSRTRHTYRYTLVHNDIKESVRHDRSLSHRIIRSFFVLHFHRISFRFFLLLFSFSNTAETKSVLSLTSRFLQYETKSIVRSPIKNILPSSLRYAGLENVYAKFEEIKVSSFFFLI